ncbi:hypothetical protein [Cellulomonas wangsupingiae]|uniref:DUF4232 domain-containing protein n=1 Tax=Cellulomonas wangsupingiae TaxID=2968085 RepID=A0ABY5K6V7_9CELL|nr:hypothetical protein [Cellulomonas wangsupingiae]MCC2336321.1 hypothetical protein [Cellulomonas wangsupingiae]MCM0640677.1 hypothetical protein [Cellulomonas wangsupingiae]UUI65700.1 hypothetical protein NP075_02895 [Cellulomonas wangsupingiae]
MNDRTRPPGNAPRPARPAPRPAPRPPARVFWVRRLVVLGIPLVLIVVLVVWLTGRGGEGTPQTEAPVTPQADTSAPSVEPEGGVPACAPAQLALAATPGAQSFPAGVDPTFEIAVTNSGPEPCLVDAGDAQREVIITSGDDRVWSSRDCAPAEGQERTLLLAGGQSDVTQLGWSRERSALGCADGLPSPGAGTYAVTVSLGGATSPAAVFGLG